MRKYSEKPTIQFLKLVTLETKLGALSQFRVRIEGNGGSGAKSYMTFAVARLSAQF
jgi:hypothetical protein